MAQPLNSGDIVQVAIVTEYQQQQCLNVLHYRFAGAAYPNYRVAMDDFWNQLKVAGGLVDKFKACVSNQLDITYIALQPIYPDRLVAVKKVPAAPSGDRVGAPFPSNTSAVITKKTDLATRYGIGSFHVPGISFDGWDTLTSRWSLLFVDDLAALGTKLIATLTIEAGADMVPVLFNLQQPDRATDLTAFDVQDTPRVVRRRTVGVGR